MTQAVRLLEILLDGRVHTVPELLRRVYGLNKPSSARLAARVYDLRRLGYNILSDKVKGTKWKYWMVLETSLVWKKKGESTSKK